jgi:hypothetical protein
VTQTALALDVTDPLPVGGALFSSCGAYRYWLERRWRPGSRVVCFVMLNPSDANVSDDDPTIRTCIAFAKLWGFDALVVVNLFTLVSSDPRVLATHPDPIGDARYIIHRSTAADLVIAAWGNGGALLDRGEQVRRLLTQHGVKLHHLGLTQHGHPKHPLARGRHRIARDQQPIAWEAA